MTPFRADCETCTFVARPPHRCILEKDEITSLQTSRKKLVFEKGEVIIKSGTRLDGVFSIRKGCVRIQKRGEDGKVHWLRLAREGEMLGVSYLFSDGDRRTDAVAQDQVRCCFIPRQTVLALASSNPDFGMMLLRQLAQETQTLEERLSALLEKKTVSRIAETILYFEEAMLDSWTRRDVAEWAGTTVENVIRTISDFEKSGILRREGKKLDIVSPHALTDLARAR